MSINANTRAENFKFGEGAARLDRKQRRISFPQFGSKIGGREISSIAQLAGLGVDDAVKNDVAEVGGANFVDFGVGECPANGVAVPGFMDGSAFVAQVASGFENFGGNETIDCNYHGFGLSSN